MSPNLPHIQHWRLLTPQNIRVRRLWGWGHSIQKIVTTTHPYPYEGNQLLVASDYGGEHSTASHLIYCYLVVGQGAPAWFSAIASVRRSMLKNDRRMAYKRLDDSSRQAALIPYLQAASELDGHLVAIAVDKRKKWLSTAPEMPELRKALRLTASWNARALEAMMRKTQIFAILASVWSRPNMDITWITDQDEFVANDRRHDDALKTAAFFTSLYISYPMGIFALNTTSQDSKSRDFEDLCAIPDLAAGMLSDVSQRFPKDVSWEVAVQKTLNSELPIKAEILADWFWDDSMPLRKTLITIDVEDTKFSVRKVWQQQTEPEGTLLLPDRSPITGM